MYWSIIQAEAPWIYPKEGVGGIIRSGMDMLLVGLGVAVVAYFIGWLLTGHL